MTHSHKIILAFLVVFYSISLVLALQGTYKLNDPVYLTQSCFQSGAICDTCNISSITSPTSTLILSNKIMTKGSSEFNYTFHNSSYLGIYYVNGYCTYGLDVQNWRYSFEVTPTGEKLGTYDAILYIGILLLLLILLIGSLYKLFTQDNMAWFLGFLAISYFLLVSLVFMSGKIVNNFIPSLPAIGQFFDIALLILIILMFPLLLFMLFYPLYLKAKNKEKEDMMAMGYSAEETKQFRR